MYVLFLLLLLLTFLALLLYARYGPSTGQYGKPLHDDTQFLLIMVIADRAIFGISSLNNLHDQQIPQGKEEVIL